MTRKGLLGRRRRTPKFRGKVGCCRIPGGQGARFASSPWSRRVGGRIVTRPNEYATTGPTGAAEREGNCLHLAIAGGAAGSGPKTVSSQIGQPIRRNGGSRRFDSSSRDANTMMDAWFLGGNDDFGSMRTYSHRDASAAGRASCVLSESPSTTEVKGLRRNSLRR